MALLCWLFVCVYHREQKAASTLKAKAKLYQKLARGEVQGVEVGYTLYKTALFYCT
jgi:hypothetical protein